MGERKGEKDRKENPGNLRVWSHLTNTSRFQLRRKLSNARVSFFPHSISPKNSGGWVLCLILQLGSRMRETERETDSIFWLSALRPPAKSFISISFFSPVIMFLFAHSPVTPPDLSTALLASCFPWSTLCLSANINFLSSRLLSLPQSAVHHQRAQTGGDSPRHQL